MVGDSILGSQLPAWERQGVRFGTLAQVDVFAWQSSGEMIATLPRVRNDDRIACRARPDLVALEHSA